MKKGWKIFWITCIIAAGSGIALCMIAWGMGVTSESIARRLPNGVGFGVLTGDSYFGYIDDEGEHHGAVREADSREEFQGVGSIDMEVWASVVNVRTLDDTEDRIIVETKNIDKRLKLRYYMDGDELKFRTKYRAVGLNTHERVGEINIYIPRNYRFKEASFELGAGELYINDIKADQFGVDIGAGEAVIDNFTVDELDLNCGAGEITARGEAVREVDIDCGVGAVTYTALGNEADYNYNIKCGIGEVVCGSSSYSGIANERNIDNGGQREMSIDCGVGEVTVDFEAQM